MLIGSPPSTPYSLLCVRSRRVDHVADEVLRHYPNSCVVHDADAACRKAKFGAFDAYLAFDVRSAGPALQLWKSIRAFDANTPFVLVLPAMPTALEQHLRPGFDVALAGVKEPLQVLTVLYGLLSRAEERSIEARHEAALAVQADITERLARLEHRLSLSRQSLARAQEHIMRAQAIRAFLANGGTRAFFERLWPDTFDTVLQRSYEAPQTNTANEAQQIDQHR